MEMTRPGGNRGNSQPEGRPSPGAWKPAQNAGSHISTATTAAGLLSGKKSNPAKIVGSVRFLHRTQNPCPVILSASGFLTNHCKPVIAKRSLDSALWDTINVKHEPQEMGSGSSSECWSLRPLVRIPRP